MTDETQGDAVHDKPSGQRYELATPDGPAIAAYERKGDTLVLTHTVVPPAQEGQGVASRLIAGVLSDVRARGLRFVPACAFVAAYLDRHSGERDLVAEDRGGGTCHSGMMHSA